MKTTAMHLFRLASGRMEMHEVDPRFDKWDLAVVDDRPAMPFDPNACEPPPSARVVTFIRDRFSDGGDRQWVVFVEAGVDPDTFSTNEMDQLALFALMLQAQNEMRCALERRQAAHETAQREAAALAVWDGELSPKRRAETTRMAAEALAEVREAIDHV